VESGAVGFNTAASHHPEGKIHFFQKGQLSVLVTIGGQWRPVSFTGSKLENTKWNLYFILQGRWKYIIK
jgi:hypothetical protein